MEDFDKKVVKSDSMNPLYDIAINTNGKTEDSRDETGNNPTSINKLDRHFKQSDELNEQDDVPVELGCPRVNCPEKIVICLDNSHEMINPTFQSRTGDKFSPTMLIKRALGIFLHSKHRLNPKHEFALVWLKEAAYWLCDFTSNPERILTLINSCSDSFASDTCEFSSIFEAIQQNITFPHVEDPETVPPPFIVRTVILYGRSHCVPSLTNNDAFKLLHTSPYFFVDAFYIHEPVSEDNKCEEIFDVLCSLDEKGLSYIFEVSRNPTKLYDCMAQLLGHPLQRPLQGKLHNSIQQKEELSPP